MIIRTPNGYKLVCDRCGEQLAVSATSDIDNILDENGWGRVSDDGEEFEDLCPECQRKMVWI